jgi:predicted membrane GTPase involved in stress response
MVLPLSVLLSNPAAPSQLWFAQEALPLVRSSERVAAEATDRGLLVRGLTELDLELASHSLGQRFPGLRVGNPVVELIRGTPLLEPYYLVTVTVPAGFVGDVVGDLNARRAVITSLEDTPSGNTVKADIPVIECFGYGTRLRSRTRGEGRHELTFIGHRPYSQDQDPEPSIA